MVLRNVQISFSNREKKDIFFAWALISVAFGILSFRSGSLSFIYAILYSALTVGVGFVFHELAHKFSAYYYGCDAEFKANKNMLYLAVVMSFFGFIFVAPGAVWIKGALSKKHNAYVAAAGPVTNMLLAVIFLILTPFIGSIASFGSWVNAYLGVFNLIPFAGFDGSKVLAWNKPIYAVLLIVSIILVMLV